MEGRSWTWKASFVAVRIVAVYLVVHALIVAGQSAGFLIAGGGGVERWVDIVAILVLAIAGFELWLVADGVANRIAKAADELDLPPEKGARTKQPARAPTSNIDAATALSIGLTLLGIIILVDGISGVILAIGQLLSIQSSPFNGDVTRTPLFFSLLASALRVALGAWLVFGTQNIDGLVRKLRATRTEPAEPAP